MPCYYPLDAWKTESGAVIFSGENLSRNRVVASFQVPCGRCIGCRLERARQWSVRCMHEASLYDANSFVTLTYDNDHVPEYGSLDYRHFQLFMKRLRKACAPNVVRFFMCGEYGDENLRPHYHAILFNVHFADRRRHSGTGPNTLYISRTLEGLWPYGMSSIGSVTFESAGYVARYSLKKVTGDEAESHYTTVDVETGEIRRRVPEFCHMSLKPGIGAGWLAKYLDDVYPNDFVVSRGTEAKPPRYYDKLLAKVSDRKILLDDVEFSRYSKAIDKRDEGSPERLSIRETVLRSRMSGFKRSL